MIQFLLNKKYCNKLCYVSRASLFLAFCCLILRNKTHQTLYSLYHLFKRSRQNTESRDPVLSLNPRPAIQPQHIFKNTYLRRVSLRFTACHPSNLNGYNVPSPGFGSAWNCISWYPFTDAYTSLAAVEMAIR